MSDWTDGLDLRGVDAEELDARWRELVGYGRKEVFLLCAQEDEKPNWRWARGLDSIGSLVDPREVLAVKQGTLQAIIDVLARHGETSGLDYAAEYNTRPQA